MRPIRFVAPVVATALLAGLAGCGSNDSDNSRSAVAPAATPTVRTTATGDAPLLVAEAWTAAVPDAAAGTSTQVYAQIVNTGGAPLTISRVSTSASSRAEFARTVERDGRPESAPAGPLAINPGVVRVLQPGGLHIVVHDLPRPVPAGTGVAVTLTTSDGRKVTFLAVARTPPDTAAPNANGTPG